MPQVYVFEMFIIDNIYKYSFINVYQRCCLLGIFLRCQLQFFYNNMLIPNKWHADGAVERFKVRHVAQGFIQTEGLDYFETFSPVAKLFTARLFLALASTDRWHLHQFSSFVRLLLALASMHFSDVFTKASYIASFFRCFTSLVWWACSPFKLGGNRRSKSRSQYKRL